VQNDSAAQVLEHLILVVQNPFKSVIAGSRQQYEAALFSTERVKGHVLFYFKCVRYRLDNLDVLSYIVCLILSHLLRGVTGV